MNERRNNDLYVNNVVWRRPALRATAGAAARYSEYKAICQRTLHAMIEC